MVEWVEWTATPWVQFRDHLTDRIRLKYFATGESGKRASKMVILFLCKCFHILHPSPIVLFWQNILNTALFWWQFLFLLYSPILLSFCVCSGSGRELSPWPNSTLTPNTHTQSGLSSLNKPNSKGIVKGSFFGPPTLMFWCDGSGNELSPWPDQLWPQT